MESLPVAIYFLAFFGCLFLFLFFGKIIFTLQDVGYLREDVKDIRNNVIRDLQKQIDDLRWKR